MGNPTLPIILMGDFNIGLEIRDNISRNADNNDISPGNTDYVPLTVICFWAAVLRFFG